jgi:adenylate cyclase
MLMSVAVALLAALADSTAAGRRLEERFDLRWLFSLRGAVPAPAHVAIVAMNRHSAQQLLLPRDPLGFHRCGSLAIGKGPAGHQDLPTLPARWPRCLHALAIERLSAAGARAIVFDVLFRERRPVPVPGVTEDLLRDEDLLLARAARRSGRVLIAQKLEPGPGEVLMPSALSPAVQDAVLGMAPYPLTVTGTDRYDRFNVVVDEGWPTVTLATIAALAYALPAYPEFRELLSRVEPDLAADLPAEVARLAAGQLQATALMLHMAFREDLTLRERLLAELEAGAARRPREQQLLLRLLLEALSGPPARYSNFYGPPGAVPTLDFSVVLSLDTEQLARHVADKVIIVGYLDDEVTEQVEHFPTAAAPPDQVGHSGAEILATAVANLIEGSELRAASPVQRRAVFLALAALICAGGVWFGAAAAATAAVVGGVGHAAMALLAFQHLRLWLPLALPLAVVVPLSLAAALVYRYQEARRQRDRIRALFAKFVPPEFVESFERKTDSLVSARRSLECACVATDAAHFTTVAEALQPQELAELLNRYFDRLFRPVAQNGGLISDVVGDAMLALWPARDPQTRASVCRALLEMLDASAEFSESAGGGLSTRFGADLGPVSLGALGGHEHYEYRAVGDPVNTASRLQELNKDLGTRILVSGALVADLEEFLLRDLGWFQLRGKTREVRVHELVGLRATATPRTERLCAQFSLISEAVRGADLPRARALLRRVQSEYPDDPPARLLLLALDRPGRVRQGTILMD